jgi:hypothetical protein
MNVGVLPAACTESAWTVGCAGTVSITEALTETLPGYGKFQ